MILDVIAVKGKFVPPLKFPKGNYTSCGQITKLLLAAGLDMDDLMDLWTSHSHYCAIMKMMA